MTKKNLRPQQVAPVKRETTATSSCSEERVGVGPQTQGVGEEYPFAGDDAE